MTGIDVDFMYRLMLDPAVSRQLDGTPSSVEEAAAFVTRYSAISWIVASREDAERLGFLTLSTHGPSQSGEVGTALAADARGKGLGRESLRAVLGYGFDRLRLRSIGGRCYPDNVAATQLVRSMGMRLIQQVADPGGRVGYAVRSSEFHELMYFPATIKPLKIEHLQAVLDVCRRDLGRASGEFARSIMDAVRAASEAGEPQQHEFGLPETEQEISAVKDVLARRRDSMEPQAQRELYGHLLAGLDAATTKRGERLNQ